MCCPLEPCCCWLLEHLGGVVWDLKRTVRVFVVCLPGGQGPGGVPTHHCTQDSDMGTVCRSRLQPLPEDRDGQGLARVHPRLHSMRRPLCTACRCAHDVRLLIRSKKEEQGA